MFTVWSRLPLLTLTQFFYTTDWHFIEHELQIQEYKFVFFFCTCTCFISFLTIITINLEEYNWISNVLTTAVLNCYGVGKVLFLVMYNFLLGFHASTLTLHKFLKFEVLTTARIHLVIICLMASCNLASGTSVLEEHITSMSRAEDEGSMLLLNMVSTY